MNTPITTETVAFGGGCFWCTEAAFSQLKGVTVVIPGYTGGTVTKPTYQEVCGGGTGHAEVVRIAYDPSIIGFTDLLSVFFTVHDPTTLNRQGNDTGTQYRSAIYYTSPAQKEEIEVFVKKLTDEKVFSSPVVTEVAALTNFYEAEDYHQRYYENNKDNPYCQAIINPKLKKLRERYAKLLTEK